MDTIVVYLKFLSNIQYDGTVPSKRFLKAFEDIKNRISALNPTFDDDFFYSVMITCLINAHPTPRKGYDNKPYVSPVTWHGLREDVGTYTQLVDMLREKYPGIKKGVSEATQEFSHLSLDPGPGREHQIIETAFIERSSASSCSELSDLTQDEDGEIRKRNEPRVQLPTNIQAEGQVSPAIKVPCWVGDYLLQEVRVVSGAHCNLVDPETANAIVDYTPGQKLHTDRNWTTVAGYLWKTNVLGYLDIDIDLGQGVMVRDIIYAVKDVPGGRGMLLGRPFLAALETLINTRHDTLIVRKNGPPATIIKGRKYLGNGRWEEGKLARSIMSVINQAEIEEFRKVYVGLGEGIHLENEQGDALNPWLVTLACEAVKEADKQSALARDDSA